MRLGEHRELRRALGLVSESDFTTLYCFLQLLDEATIDRAVGETVRQLRGTRRERSARSLCGACIITGKNRCRGDIG